MLHRQRVILSMLAGAGGAASHLHVTKWAFLLRQHTADHGGSSFYQFVPYHYGPFSFCLHQEAAALVRDGLLIDHNDRWELTDAGRAAVQKTTPQSATAVRSILQKYGQLDASALMDRVYGQYPWFTINSQRQQLARRPLAPVAVFTAGYEGLLVDGFLNGLLKAGIRRLIDVRNNPIARRYGFHRSTLSRLCSKLNIDYQHVPELGIPSSQRQDLNAPGARDKLFTEYEATTLHTQNAAVKKVCAWMREIPSVLVCMEAAACDCHRSRLATTVAKETGLTIEHLEIHP
jgi:uncharacterized protein (DUF488 family)